VKIVTLTINPTVDTSSSTDKVAPDRKLRCTRPQHEPGGGGINVARAIAQLGGEALAVYPAGGTNGQMLRQLLDNEKIAQEVVAIEDETRENVTVAEEDSDQQFRFVMPGPNISEDERRELVKTLTRYCKEADYFVLSGSLPGEVPKDFYADLAARVKECNSKVIVDTSGEPLRQSLGEGIYLFKPNLRELGDMVDGQPEGDEQIVKAVRGLINEGAVEVGLVSLGAGGAILVSSERSVHYRSPTVKIESKVGAGDSMVAGLVLALSRGEDVAEAARFGVAAGAAAVMTPGSELCRREDAERLVEQVAGQEI
jgi:6-phosphofructokinase 2